MDRVERGGQANGERIDVLGDVLQTARMTNLVYGRFELGTPWALKVPSMRILSFYVVSQNGVWLKVDGIAKAIALSAGDVVFLPHGPAHTLRDMSGRPVAEHELDAGKCTAPMRQPGALHIGGNGPKTVIVGGCFRHGSTAQSPIFDALPPVIHLPTGDPQASPWVAATVQLILAESQAPGLASGIVLGRLVDVLLVQALRVHAATPACQEHGLRALRDPCIGGALERMHAQPARRWTVEELAQAVGQSRSGFAARFHDLVGEPPLQYLARWRMNKAAELLREGDESLTAVAEIVGYESGPAFMKAFKRWQGDAPGAYRKKAREAVVAARQERRETLAPVR